MKNQSELTQKLNKINKIFKINKVLNLKTNKEYIQKYYKVNKIPYSLFHTKTDLMYMGISRDGVYKEDDLLEAAMTVEKYLKKLKGDKVLELATGRGANSFYLAQRFPTVEFYGTDISKGQLDYAFKKAKKVNNYHPNFGDYHDLSKFENETFDIVFIVEALCYSAKKQEVLNEIYRILKKGGVLIIFDGYANKNPSQLTDAEKLASKLAEKGVAIEKFESYQSFLEKVKKAKFKIELEEDASQFILPTIERFEKMSKLFFKIPFLAKLLSIIFPKEFLYNTISAYLFPILIKMNIAVYMITILKKDT